MSKGENIMKIHFIGIGGISMSGLAAICLDLAYEVSGSDNVRNKETEKLVQKGATVYLHHHKENISADLDTVVYTAAIRDDNPELLRAKELGLNICDRAHFLGHLMAQYRNGIAVSGTHGKTSTTSMISSIFLNSDLDPTITIGGNLKEIQGNYKIGSNEFFITEACEYVDSFLSLQPKYEIILNIEHEHIDYFKTLEQEMNSFRKFASQIPSDGKIFANGDDQNVRSALQGLDNVVYFGFSSENDCIISDYKAESFGSRFNLLLNHQSLGSFELNALGKFNASNATAAILCAYFAGVDIEIARQGISQYHGVDRRFEKKGVYKGALIFDDYAHHPTEVRATLSAAKDLRKNRLITIFQPHTFSRTFSFMSEFERSFDDTDVLIIADIYPSREIDTGYVHAKDLYRALQPRLQEVYYLGDKDAIIAFLDQYISEGDIIIAMGAGDINQLSEKLIAKTL